MTRLNLLLLGVPLLVLGVLLADGPELSRQAGLALITGIGLLLLVRSSSVSGAQVAAAMVLATGLEFLGSLVWGLYRYRDAAIPFYVPFGHGIFYVMACELSSRRWLVRRQRTLLASVLIGFTGYALISLAFWRDTSGLVMWSIAAAFLALSPSRRLLAVCCLLTIQLEWVGTALGNWRWAEIVPGLGLSSANPPSGVGVCYCLLDALTVAVVGSAWFRRLEDGGTERSVPSMKVAA